jgi:hypothetical protein
MRFPHRLSFCVSDTSINVQPTNNLSFCDPLHLCTFGNLQKPIIASMPVFDLLGFGASERIRLGCAESIDSRQLK